MEENTYTEKDINTGIGEGKPKKFFIHRGHDGLFYYSQYTALCVNITNDDPSKVTHTNELTDVNCFNWDEAFFHMDQFKNAIEF